MTYEEALSYIHSVAWKGSIPGLTRIAELCEKLGNPQKDIRFVHVAGTNGKGSVCSMLSSVLKEAGYVTGIFTSPYVKFFEERMCINGEPISKEELAEITEQVKTCADTMSDVPTEFEIITAIGFIYFKRHNCNIAVLEVGMGGRLDCTNIIEAPVVSIITGIALDHMEYLGNTTAEIAKEKAGIIKRNCPVVFGGTDKSAEEVIKAKALENCSEYCKVNYNRLNVHSYTAFGSVFDFGEYKNLSIKLAGSYQPKNAAIVLTALKVIKDKGYIISEESIRKGLGSAEWNARFEILQKNNPCVIYDGCHNPEGVGACVDSIKKIFGEKKLVLLSGVMKDKDYSIMINTLSDITEKVFTVKPNNTRAFDSEEYAKEFIKHGINAIACSSVYEGLNLAYKYAKEHSVPLLISGSLYMYEEIIREAKKIFLN